MVGSIQQLLDAAAALGGELQQLRGRFEALGLAHGREWVGRELAGYPAGSAVPRYREVSCAIRGELAGPAGATEVAPLPTAHLNGGDRTLIRHGVGQLGALSGRDGSRPEEGAFLRDIDPQRYALYLRGMPAERAGWRVLKAWESIPVTSLLQMLQDIGEYGRAMHEDAVRRQRAAPGP